MVDDNRDFLMNFSLQLDPSLAYCMFSSAHEALRQLKQIKNDDLITKKILSHYEGASDDPLSQQSFTLNLNAIQNEVYNKNRFNEVGVVLVDYDMPGINGVEFCQQIKNIPVKKIMLTGKADEKLAIDAFNKGLIDAFVQKQSSDIITSINDNIAALQYDYFQNVSKLITKLLAMDNTTFINDTAFIEFFVCLCKEKKIVEYYLIDITGSFLMLDADAKPSFLTVKLYDDLELHYELAQNAKAEEAVLDDIRSGNKIPFALQTKDYYGYDASDWKKNLYHAEELKGENTYYYAYITADIGYNNEAQPIASYHQYLEKLDNANSAD